MRILIYPGGTKAENIGDLAMLTTALERLREIWPEARIQVLTDDAGSLLEHCPGIEAVPVRGFKRWFRVKALPRFLFPEIPPAVRSQFPLRPDRLWRVAAWSYRKDFRLAREFALALFRADLFVLAGCGLINDEFPTAATRVLDIFDAAATCSIPTVMLGQGIGPITNPVLLQRAMEVFPGVGRIHLREKRFSQPLLEKIGVSLDKVFITGDDAIEMSYRVKRSTSGTRLGINLRCADYSAINDSMAQKAGTVIAEKARLYGTEALGIPILIRDADSDLESIALLLGNEAVSDSGLRGSPALREILRRTGECRVVVTGSYHAAVFALAQGIPVTGIVRSLYYHEKFTGLADQFGAGCLVLRIDDEEFSGKLGTAIDQLWSEAELLRPGLLQAAESQIIASRTAYERIPELVKA